MVLRLYESKGCAGTTILSVPGNVKRIFSCNMLEEKQEELELKNYRTELKFRAFEIKTLMLEI